MYIVTFHCDSRNVDLFFFFKQKTAYEMRISDWSSDVCSSDLHGTGGAEGIARLGTTVRRRRARLPARRLLRRPGHDRGHAADGADRKSVVSGKSVSVRVDLGGRRIIKKNQSHSNLHNQSFTIFKNKHIVTHLLYNINLT